MVYATLAVSDGGGGFDCELLLLLGSMLRRAAREFVSDAVEVGLFFSIAMPVVAVHISAIGGVGSVHGTVNKGLSQRLWVLGSSYLNMRLWCRSDG